MICRTGQIHVKWPENVLNVSKHMFGCVCVCACACFLCLCVSLRVSVRVLDVVIICQDSDAPFLTHPRNTIPCDVKSLALEYIGNTTNDW